MKVRCIGVESPDDLTPIGTPTEFDGDPYV
jgi:hypothetical protein